MATRWCTVTQRTATAARYYTVKIPKEEHYSQKTAAARTVSNNFRKQHWLFQLPLLRSLIFFNFSCQPMCVCLINSQLYAYTQWVSTTMIGYTYSEQKWMSHPWPVRGVKWLFSRGRGANKKYSHALDHCRSKLSLEHRSPWFSIWIMRTCYMTEDRSWVPWHVQWTFIAFTLYTTAAHSYNAVPLRLWP